MFCGVIRNRLTFLLFSVYTGLIFLCSVRHKEIKKHQDNIVLCRSHLIDVSTFMRPGRTLIQPTINLWEKVIEIRHIVS